MIVPALTDLAELGRPSPPSPRPLAFAWRTYERELDKESAQPGSLPDPKLASSVPNQTVKWV